MAAVTTALLGRRGGVAAEPARHGAVSALVGLTPSSEMRAVGGLGGGRAGFAGFGLTEAEGGRCGRDGAAAAPSLRRGGRAGLAGVGREGRRSLISPQFPCTGDWASQGSAPLAPPLIAKMPKKNKQKNNHIFLDEMPLTAGR